MSALDDILAERFTRIDAAGDLESIRKAAWFGAGQLHQAFVDGLCTMAEHDKAANALTSHANQAERNLNGRIQAAMRGQAQTA